MLETGVWVSVSQKINNRMCEEQLPTQNVVDRNAFAIRQESSGIVSRISTLSQLIFGDNNLEFMYDWYINFDWWLMG